MIKELQGLISMIRSDLNQVYAIELLEYENKNHLSGNNKTRNDEKRKLVNNSLELLDSIEKNLSRKFPKIDKQEIKRPCFWFDTISRCLKDMNERCLRGNSWETCEYGKVRFELEKMTISETNKDESKKSEGI